MIEAYFKVHIQILARTKSRTPHPESQLLKNQRTTDPQRRVGYRKRSSLIHDDDQHP